MRITSKGQVTIPIELRQKFSLLPHTEVEFRGNGDGVLIRKAATGARRRRAEMREHLRRMRGAGTVKLTTDEIMRMTRGE